MEPNLEQKIILLEEKVDKIYISVEKTRKYFFWTMIITVALFVLPLIALFFVAPSFLGTYTDNINSLSI